MYSYIKVSKFTFALIIVALASGCQYKGPKLLCLPYSADIDQGRVIDIEKIKMLRENLTSDQVRILLGKPTIIKDGNWEYFHYCCKPNEEPKITKLTLEFVENKLKIWYKKP
ncbi:outer membrane protein assembly factor BamE [Candidatus Kinetoplastidibacterium galati]|uniref:Outer membrane lipoprotein OmlA n=1 Tax=Candidatus Kinetoplastidibacterium galati TCC219 TaxID=1208921 RepID=M1L9N3_9PROT|nr:outer membrane protein assembly factor BamE [Candidatus Kinetoplastibacterium galatii]AGF49233.1 outer membrane lipoprotein OmlA [Candidatus Kinetoplastibacterium galatii TCC219]